MFPSSYLWRVVKEKRSALHRVDSYATHAKSCDSLLPLDQPQMSLRHAPGREDDDVREAVGEQTSSVAKHVLEKERDSDIDAQNQELKAFLGTTSFGKKEIERDLDAAYDHTKRNSNQVRQQNHIAAEDSDDSIEASSDDDETQLPITHEIILKKHQRAV